MNREKQSNNDEGLKRLTTVELELMKYIWDLGEASVRDVLSMLPEERRLAYTSVSTILRILEQKGILRSRKEGRAHIYTPTLEKKTYEANSLTQLVDDVFEGTPTALVRRLLETKKLTEADIEEIKKMLLARSV